MGILLGLLTALTWGGADFIARFATHRIGALRSMLYMQLTGFLLLSFLLPALGGWGHLADGSGWQPWASAGYPALTLLLSWMTGERLSTVRISGIICTLVGVVVVAGGEKTPDENDAEAVQRSGRGIGWAIFAAIGFALLFWLLGIRIIARVGAVQTVWMIRLTSTVLTAAVILVSKQSIRLPRGEVRWMALSMGVFDTSAFVLSNRGMQMEQVAVISVLGSLYGAVTVGLAAIFLKEHVSRWQWMGIVTIFVGIFLISR